MNKKTIIIIVIIVFILAVFAIYFFGKDYFWQLAFQPTNTEIPQGQNIDDNNLQDEQKIKTLNSNLQIPWEIVFLPDNSMLVTERVGNLLHIKNNEEKVIKVEGVEHAGEGGLLGAVLHPDFSDNKWLYLYLTTREGNGLINRVERYYFDEDDDLLLDQKTIIDNIPGANYHDGGRIDFGPDGLLYITTGDAGNGNFAQDKNSLAGKILRLKDDGSIPEDNPFANEIYSYGHRNPQGLAWDSKGNLWASEHGPSGLNSGYDEINLIKKGYNYGWPEVKGEETGSWFTQPVIQSGADDTWAPAGLAIVDDMILFAGLRGASLYSGRINGEEITDLKINFRNDFGRLRAVVQGPDGNIYLSTSNTDGRGQDMGDDDRIIKIDSSVLK